jgi:hypothetical protein
MFRFASLLFGMLVRLFRGRQSLLLENLALRQQLVALKRRHPRPSLGLFDKLFWVVARRVLVGLEAPSSSSRRNRRPLAPEWFSYVLAVNTPIMIAGLSGTVAMIGPGIWSIDAKLYGRKYLEDPRH